MADKFIDMINGVPTLKTPLGSSAGSGDAGKIPKLDSGGKLDASMMPSIGLFSAMAILEDQKSDGTNGGAFSSGAWRTRDLNTEVSDAAGIVSLSANQFTLSAGTYLILCEAPGYYINRHKAAIYNVTDSSYAAYGQSSYCSGVPAASTTATVSTVLTIGGTKAFELRHRCETTNATTGFGPASSFGVIEVYSRVTIYKMQ